MSGSEYDPFFGADEDAEDDLAPVRERFRAASRSFLASPWSWLAWSLLLPAAALATPVAARRAGPAGVLFTWSAAILAGGAVEGALILRAGRRAGAARARTPIAAWALRTQGNLSLVGLALSALLLLTNQAWALPGLWLLLLGHSFYVLGGLASPALRTCGLIFQAGGFLALAAFFWPGIGGPGPLGVFAGASFLGCLWMTLRVWREGRGEASPAIN